MNNLAPLLCLGFDGGAPLLKKIYPSTAFFWNLIFLNSTIFVIALILATSLPVSTKIQTILFGISASTTLAITITIANYKRSQGDTRRYFLSVNVYDRLLRTGIIIGSALILHGLSNWAIAVCLLSGTYACYIAKLTKTKIDINHQSFIKQLKTSIPFIFVSLAIVVVSRAPFYASYFFDDSVYAAKLDFFLLFSLFILIPFLNQSKIQEARSEASLNNYMDYMHQGRRNIFFQELLIISLMLSLILAAIYLEITNTHDIKYLYLPILCGMILLSCIPNFIQLMCFSLKGGEAILYSIILGAIIVLTYIPKTMFKEISTTYLFLISSVLYVSFGFFVAKKLRIKLKMFCRTRRTIALLTLLGLFSILI